MKRILVIACMTIALMARAQSNTPLVPPATWTLEQCIQWAKQQSIALQRNRISAEQSRLDIANARADRLPAVTFSTSQGFSNRPFQANSMTVNGTEVTLNSHNNNYSGNYSIGASMPLYDGGKISNNVRLQEINLQIAELAYDQTALSLEENITKLYVQILYAAETLRQDSAQIVLAEQQLDRARALFKAGLLNRADVAQMESTLANDQYQLVADRTSLDDYLLQIKQLMELDGDYTLTLADPELTDDVLSPLPNKADIFTAALLSRPEIRAQQLAIDRSDVDIKMAQTGNKPTINANASVGTSNTTGNGNMFTQLKDQWNNTLGVVLNLPVYDRGKTRNAVARARLERENALLTLTDKQKTLYKTIENYYLQAQSAQQRYRAAQVKVDAAQTSFELTSEQFRLGLKNIIELLTDKTTLAASTRQMLQAKYMALLNIALLKWYGNSSAE